MSIFLYFRYSSYTLEALQLAKFMIRSLLGQKLPTKAQDLIMKAVSPTNILKILREYDGANQNGGIHKHNELFSIWRVTKCFQGPQKIFAIVIMFSAMRYLLHLNTMKIINKI